MPGILNRYREASFLAQSLIQNASFQDPVSWSTNTPYSIGDQVVSNGNIYAATKAGVSSSTGPSVLQGTQTDGSVIWLYIRDAVGQNEVASNLYIALGRSTVWADEANPPAPDLTVLGSQNFKANIQVLLRLNSAEMSLGLKKNEWTSGTIYTQFAGQIYSASRYVTVNNTDVYKCIDNNNGAESTVKPNSKTQGYFVLSDGYIWKYMGSAINPTVFSTANYIGVTDSPVTGSDQYLVQQSARKGELSSFGPITQNGTGTITTARTILRSQNNAAPVTPAVVFAHVNGGTVDRVAVQSPGNGYGAYTFIIVREDSASPATTPGQATAQLTNGTLSSVTVSNASTGYSDGAIAFVIGDGTGANVSVSLDGSNKISSISVDSSGTGYTWAEIVIVPGTIGFISKAVLAPDTGHGYSIVTELGADTLIISKAFLSSNAPYVQPSFFRQIGLVTAVKPLTGSRVNAPAYLGPDNTYFNVTSQAGDKYDTSSGHVIYLNNIQATEHATDQDERVKIAITL